MPYVTQYCFCEAPTTGSKSRWHIRPLTELGRKLSGGADTVSLCGRTISWDNSVETTDLHLEHCCRLCMESYRERY
jgi:hypothetical protein